MKTETNRSMGYYGTGTHLFNDGWEFAKQPLFTSCEEVKQHPEVFVPVGLPHDWLIFQGTDLYVNGAARSPQGLHSSPLSGAFLQP